MNIDKKQIEIILTSILAVVLITVIFTGIKKIKNRAVLNASMQQVLPVLPQSIGAVPRQPISWKRCPFSGKIYADKSGNADLKLVGVAWDEKTPQALINDKIIKEGDSIGNYKIIKIEKDRVIITDGVKDTELLLWQ